MLYFELQVTLPLPPAALRLRASLNANSAIRLLLRSVMILIANLPGIEVSSAARVMRLCSLSGPRTSSGPSRPR